MSRKNGEEDFLVSIFCSVSFPRLASFFFPNRFHFLIRLIQFDFKNFVTQNCSPHKLLNYYFFLLATVPLRNRAQGWPHLLVSGAGHLQGQAGQGRVRSTNALFPKRFTMKNIYNSNLFSYVPGEAISIWATVANQSKVTIKHTRASLTEVIIYSKKAILIKCLLGKP